MLLIWACSKSNLLLRIIAIGLSNNEILFFRVKGCNKRTIDFNLNLTAIHWFLVVSQRSLWTFMIGIWHVLLLIGRLESLLGLIYSVSQYLLGWIGHWSIWLIATSALPAILLRFSLILLILHFRILIRAIVIVDDLIVYLIEFILQNINLFILFFYHSLIRITKLLLGLLLLGWSELLYLLQLIVNDSSCIAFLIRFGKRLW
jgi:hypothetical protein